MIGKRHLADVVQGRAAFQHVDKIGVHLIGKGCSARGFLRQNSVDSISGKNTGNNLGPGSPVFHFHQHRGDTVDVRPVMSGEVRMLDAVTIYGRIGDACAYACAALTLAALLAGLSTRTRTH